MRSLLYILILGGIFSPNAHADTASFNCQLKDFVILATEDGKTKRYSGFTDSYDVGDMFGIEMTIDETVASPQIEFDVVWKGKSLVQLVSPVVLKTQIVRPGDPLRFDGPLSEYAIGPNYFEIDGLFETLILRRYYKGDWQGLWIGAETSEESVSSFVGTLNCMDASKSIDPVYSKIYGLTSAELID